MAAAGVPEPGRGQLFERMLKEFPDAAGAMPYWQDSLRDRFTLCCAADHAHKPDPAGLVCLPGRFHCLAQEMLFIFDTATDEACAAAAGVPFAWAPPL